MAFNSFAFALFFSTVFPLFLLTPQRWRHLVVLAASLGFYAHGAPFLLVALAVVVISSYVAGRLLGRLAGVARIAVFWSAVGFNVLILATVKHAPALFGHTFGLLGVSYYVLQSIGYLSDVYTEATDAEYDLGFFALFLAFFPKLLQGPIERADTLLPQLRALRLPGYATLRRGLVLVAFGLFKKLVIADRLGLYVDPVFDDVHAQSGTALLVATYFYAFQLYFDFSGYTDVALGIAKLFNVDLTENFNSPYLATSVADFWRRWHISLSRWILGYLFRPLQFALRYWRLIGTAIAIFIAFFASGVWHGVGWTFIVWGLLHGFYLATGVLLGSKLRRLRQRVPKRFGTIVVNFDRLVTFHLVCLAWIFFRAPSVADGWYVLSHVGLHPSQVQSFALSQGSMNLAVLAVALGCAALAALVKKSGNPLDRLFQAPVWLRWGVYYALAISLPLLAVPGHSRFIYLQF